MNMEDFEARLEQLKQIRMAKIDSILLLVEDERAVKIIRPYLEYFSNQIGAMERRIGLVEMRMEVMEVGQSLLVRSHFGTEDGTLRKPTQLQGNEQNKD